MNLSTSTLAPQLLISCLAHIASGTDRILVIDPEYKIIAASPAMLNFLNKISKAAKTMEQILYQPVMDVITDCPSLTHVLSKLLNQNKTIGLHDPYSDHTWNIETLQHDNKSMGYMIRSKATQDHGPADLMIYLDQIADAMPGNFYWKDKAGYYRGCNSNLLRNLKISKSDIIDKTDIDLWPEHAAALRANDHQVMKTRQPLHVEEAVTFPQGKAYFSAVKVPWYDAHGEIIGIIGNSLDITELSDAATKLRENLSLERKKAEAASRSKSAFISNMSHDIRTPITGILAMAEQMLTSAQRAATVPASEAPQRLSDLAHQVKTDSQLLMSATNELLTLSNSILEIVQLESGQAIEKKEQFSLPELIEQTLSLIRPAAAHKQLDLLSSIDPRVPKHFEGLRLYLSRCLLNLISNAIKFTDKGSIKLSVACTYDTYSLATGKTVHLTFQVQDTGIGIPEDKQHIIFENFSRLSASYDGIYKGSGMGLYAVRNYVDAMQGNIRVASTVNQGSCFTMVIPLVIVDALDAEDNDLISEPIATPVSNPDTEPFNFLVVEDSQLAFVGLKMALKQYTCLIDHAKTAAESIEMTQKKKYDLVLMDVGLPDFSGIKATEAIRKIHSADTLPIIAVSGHGDDDCQKQACLASGMQVVLSKPARVGDMVILKHYLGGFYKSENIE